MANPYYTVTNAPVTQSRGVSATIRSEYSLINTGFDAVYVAMLLRGLKAGETWTGTHVFTGATVTVATQSASDNSTKAASTAYVDGAVSTSAALKANIASPTLTGTPAAPTAAAGTNTTQIATTAFVRTEILAGVTGYASTIIETHTATPSQTVFNLSNTYTVGVNGINVYINGVRQFPSAFTETSTSVITLSSGATSGDVVLFEIGVITSGTATAASAVTFSPTADIPETTLQSALANYATGHGATQAQMEAASATTVFATPAVVKNHPGVAKFWVKCDAAGNIEASHNVTSITDGGTGLLTVTIATDFSSANYVVTASAHAGGTANWVDITSIAAGSVVLRAKDYANNAVDPTAWFVVGFGDQ